MKPIVIGRTDQGEEVFRAARKQIIGASDGPSILGLNPWSSALAVWMDKTGRAPEIETSEAMHFGNVLEDTVAREFARRNGVKVTRMNQILAHPDYPFIGATPDRRVNWHGEQAILECKVSLNPRAQKYWEEAEGGMPKMYYAQVQQQLLVTGLKRGFLAVLLSGPEYRDFEIEADPKLHESMIKMYTDFWRLVKDDIPPAHDGVSLDMAKALYPVAEPKTAIYSEARDIYDLVAMKRLYGALEKAIDNLQATIIMETGEADTIQVPGIEGPVVLHKEVTTSRWDTKALEADHPELIPEYKKESTQRRFSPQYKTLEQQPALMATAQKKLGLVLSGGALQIESKE